MRILITGSTSFIGKHLVRMLESLGYETWHLVRNKKGFDKEIVWDFVSPLSEDLPPCDIIIHLAASVYFGHEFKINQYNVNTVSTFKLVDYAQNHKAYFIFISMVGIHGNRYSKIYEDTPICPENHYAMSKYISEEVIKTFLKKYSILRICGIYGLDGPKHLGLNEAISSAVHKKKVPVLRGSGKAKRNYICVQDVARWILYLVDNYKVMPHFTGSRIKEILYLAGPEILTIEDYLQLIVKIVLPGEKIERVDGIESWDLVVMASSAPFSELTFEQYLYSIVS